MAKPKTKKMRVWLELDVDPYLHTEEPSWDACWRCASVDPLPLCEHDARKVFTLPRGNTLYEYELTARFVRKIRPEDDDGD